MTETSPLPITVVIPVKNEEGNLPKSLARLNKFTQIIAVDSGSTDATQEILKNNNIPCLQFDWNGQYPKKRNWVLLNYAFKTEWVLFLDADEFVSDKFCEEVETAISQNSHTAYWISYTNYFMGKKLRHGLPQRKLALFKVGAGLFEKIEEDNWSQLDMEVHEHPIIEGSIGNIQTPIDHQDFQGIARFLTRHVDYALWESNRYQLLKKGGLPDKLTKRQQFKYKHLTKVWYPGFYFFYTYIIRLGFLDGKAGFAYAFYKFWYFYTIRELTFEASRNI